jgi:hypothetical protein
MKVKMTGVARKELDGLDAKTRSRVIKGLNEGLVASIDTDPTLHLEELGSEVHVHSLGPQDPVVVYQVLDVDDDGQDEVVVLMLVGRQELSGAMEPGTATKSIFEDPTLFDVIPKSTRIGHELLSKIRSVER